MELTCQKAFKKSLGFIVLLMGTWMVPTVCLAALCCTTAKSWSGNEIDKVDVNLTEQHILGKKPANFFESAADMNGDKKINAADIVLMIKEIK